MAESQADGLGATFLPATNDDELPAIRVAGVLVFVYPTEDGTLRVSIDLDESELAVGPDELTPIEVTCQGHTVWTAP